MANGKEYIVCIESSFLEDEHFEGSLEQLGNQLIETAGPEYSLLVYNDDAFFICKACDDDKDGFYERLRQEPNWQSFAELAQYLNGVSKSINAKLREIILYRGRYAIPTPLETQNEIWEYTKPFVDFIFGGSSSLDPMCYNFTSNPELLKSAVLQYVAESKCMDTEYNDSNLNGSGTTSTDEEAPIGNTVNTERMSDVIEAEVLHKKEDYKSAFKIALARHQGVSHAERGTPCQDYVAVYDNDEAISAVLCDGAGSAKFAEDASRLIAHGLSEILTERCNEIINGSNEQIADIVFGSVNKIIDEVISNTNDGRTIEDYNSTFLSVTIKDNRAVIIHVGDGMIIARKSDELKTISKPENGEFSNETYFVTNPSSKGYMDVSKLILPSNLPFAFVLMSDGTEKSFFSRGKKKILSEQLLNELIDTTVDFPEDIADRILYMYLKHEITKVSRDDCSICIVASRDKKHFFDRIKIDPVERSDKMYDDICDLLKDCKNPIDKVELSKKYEGLESTIEKLIQIGWLTENNSTVTVLGYANE